MNLHPSRGARGSLAFLAFLASALVLSVLVALLFWDPWRTHGSAAKRPLLLYCAAGIRPPVEAAAQDYQREYGVEVQLQYGGSQTLLASIEASKRGDLYLPADESYLEIARTKGLVKEMLPLARMTPVLAVHKGNPKSLLSLDDLKRDGVRIAQANAEAAAVGKITMAALMKAGRWTELEKHIVVTKPTVNDVGNDVVIGAVDAGFVWDATVRQNPQLEAVVLPEFADVHALVAVGVLTMSEQPTAALHFARYLAARDKGLPLFERDGYEPVEGDPWAETPELRIFSGAMLRPAIDDTIDEFEKREGVRVTRVYNGCGILVGQMKTDGKSPDAYFACDLSFMKQVHDLFLEAVPVSTNQLVILVPKGNPHQIRSLNDLGKPGLRLGVGHEKQCALGALTQETLKQGGVHDAVMENVKVQSPTGDLLVNQLRAGSLDAVIAYVSNATEAADELEAIAIKDIPCAVAVQPVAVGRDSTYKQLTGRLLDALRSPESRQRFEAHGFHWR
ncbi:MAG TPA: molybdate ABC transporter substrate-binding protein [Planctomycetales bacterium]|jgi:molybdenum ABC transporter molybdate-binding protein|nr:molybdate ABC transporter substrate-binding protein [Planctomycetales bacterium]